MIEEFIFVTFLALTLDRLFGEPPDSLHPTVFMGNVIDFMDRHISNGVIIFFSVTILSSITGYLIVQSFEGILHLLAGAIVLKTAFSWRGLRDYITPIAKALDKDDVDRAKKMVPFIAGRDPVRLNKEGIVSTAVESIAESSVDGIISPLFYFFIFSFYGLDIGVSAAVFYRAANTLDSMLGVLSNSKGATSARIDELLNFIPARIGAVLILTSSIFLKKQSKNGLSIFWRDRNKTKSKNAGQTMSVMAGVLGVRLRKEEAYLIGDSDVKLSTVHIYDALKIVDVQILVFAIMMVVSWISIK
jgi:adenosylcobinamide-phosphate synthase